MSRIRVSALGAAFDSSVLYICDINHIYINIYIYIYIYIYVYGYTCLSIYLSIYLYTYIWEMIPEHVADQSVGFGGRFELIYT